ncbi:MAG: hypothetical protein JWM27_1028 [Gemmatimonadetes bacterium]|nr:hypothetical protein [Gemmatimonadota bacterium]
MGDIFGPDGPEEPGWDWFWDQFRLQRSTPMRPRAVPPVDDGEKLRRARIRKAALDLVQALVPGERVPEGADYAAALLTLADLIDDLDLCVGCHRNEWECTCGVEEDEAATDADDDGFGMDRVVLTALDQAGILLPTFWRGSPAQCRRVRVLVGPPPLDGWWSAHLAGQVRDAVEVRAEGRVFYIDDEDGTGWAHVTVRQGDPADSRSILPVRKVLSARDPEPPPAEAATAEAQAEDVYAALALRAGVPVERVRQFFEGATPEQVQRLVQPPRGDPGAGRDPIPLHPRGAKPWSARDTTPATAPAASPPPVPIAGDSPGTGPSGRSARRERIRSACRDLIDVYHEPKPNATDRELLDEATKVLERERKVLEE